MLGRPNATIRSRVFHGRRKLRELLRFPVRSHRSEFDGPEPQRVVAPSSSFSCASGTLDVEYSEKRSSASVFRREHREVSAP